ncbi:MAG: hypothetical protein DVB28_001245 [Verrucomicrobia bacterium]|nr:MAG: hypothetical protein DVB28_001245 [Verrucomicrobiota bacterium]
MNPPNSSSRFFAQILLPLAIFFGFAFPRGVHAQSRVSARDDLAWLKAKGTLLFEDSFDREETGNGAKAIGNGWESATADRVPHIKQAAIEAGTLKVNAAAKEAGHGVHIHHDAGFADGGVYMRFKLPGLNKGEMLQAGFVDREVSATVHAGHLGYVFLAEASVALKDSKSYYLEVKKRRDAAQGEPSREEMIAMGKATTVTVPFAVGHEWHELVLITERDVMRASLDGKVVNEYKSAGFAHPAKRWFSLGSGSTFWIDEVKVWKVN